MNPPHPITQHSHDGATLILERQAVLYPDDAKLKRLIQHHTIVRSVAAEIALEFTEIGVTADQNLAEMMAMTHDVGKIHCLEELDSPGKRHEALGEQAAEKLFGITSDISKVCQSHGWDTPYHPEHEGKMMSNEEIVATLADRLWKGSRDTQFEMATAEVFATQLGKETWEAYLLIESIFDQVASNGPERLAMTNR